MPKPKSLTFRVDDIPVDHADELLRNLKTLAEQDPDLQSAVATMAQHSLTPMDKRSVCATFSVTTTLSGEDLCARLHRSGKNYPYSYTCKFEGITPLYEDENGADFECVPGCLETDAVDLFLYYTFEDGRSAMGNDDFIRDEDIDRRVKTLSCGIAEIVPFTRVHDVQYLQELHDLHDQNGLYDLEDLQVSQVSQVVQFIHQSVQDFFIDRGLLLMGQISEPDLVGPTAHCRLSRSCLCYLDLVFKFGHAEYGRYDTYIFPLLHYATTSWVSHVKLGEPAETSPDDLLYRLGWPVEPLIQAWVKVYNALDSISSECPSRESTLVIIASRYGLMKLLSWLLNTGKVDVDSKDVDGRTPLSWAAEKGHEGVVKMLLDTGKVEVDSKDTDGRSPLSFAAENGDEAVVQMLLDTGKVDIDSKDEDGRTPLSLAIDHEHEAVIKLLQHTDRMRP